MFHRNQTNLHLIRGCDALYKNVTNVSANIGSTVVALAGSLCTFIPYYFLLPLQGPT